MRKGLKIRAILAASVIGGCACAAEMVMTATPESSGGVPGTAPSISAASKAPSGDLAHRYRRVVRRRTVVVI